MFVSRHRSWITAGISGLIQNQPESLFAPNMGPNMDQQDPPTMRPRGGTHEKV